MTRAERIEAALRTLHRTVRGYEAESFGHDVLEAAMADAEAAFSAPRGARAQLEAKGLPLPSREQQERNLADNLASLGVDPGPAPKTAAERYDALLGELDDLWRAMTDEERAQPGVPIALVLGDLMALPPPAPASPRPEEPGREASLPDDLRAAGWAVAVHNDYRLNGEPHTFWLFTRDGRAIKGEGRTDAEALNAVRALASPRAQPEERPMIKIRPSPTADTRTCDWSKVTKETLLASSKQHIRDVREGLAFFSALLEKAAYRHDHDKITAIDHFHADFQTGFKQTGWWDNHRRVNRHHLTEADGTPDDVNLIDVLDFIVDCTMAGMARSGSVRSLELPPGLLELAFANTAALLLANVTIDARGQEDDRG